MIKITAQRQGNRYFLKIKGHAGFSRGKDIVCSAVSALYFALLATAEKDKGVYSLKSREADGYGEIEFIGGINMKGAFNMAMEGFILLARNFPKNVKIERIGNYEKEN
ncbi:MAG: ribosomal-processing cysteine protease Prp, partial [Clostridia bacterium]|nr:ribosomal-processing cysteine protease Prp [Clostridia bacterium]